MSPVSTYRHGPIAVAVGWQRLQLNYGISEMQSFIEVAEEAVAILESKLRADRSAKLLAKRLGAV